MQLEQREICHMASQTILFACSYANWNAPQGFFQMLTPFPPKLHHLSMPSCTAGFTSHLKWKNFPSLPVLQPTLQFKQTHLNAENYKDRLSIRQLFQINSNLKFITKSLPHSPFCPVPLDLPGAPHPAEGRFALRARWAQHWPRAPINTHTSPQSYWWATVLSSRAQELSPVKLQGALYASRGILRRLVSVLPPGDVALPH